MALQKELKVNAMIVILMFNFVQTLAKSRERHQKSLIIFIFILMKFVLTLSVKLFPSLN